MEDLARAFPAIRVLPDNFAVLGQAIAVAKGNRARLAGVNGFVAEALASGVVAASIARASLVGVEAAPSTR
jgi:hypothetical protein